MLRVLLTVLFLLGASPVLGQENAEANPQETTTPVATNEISAEAIEARRKTAEDATDLDEETKKRVSELYRQAAEQLQRAKTFFGKTAEFKVRADAEQASKRVGEIKTQSEAIQAKLSEANSRSKQLTDKLKNPRFVPEQEPSQLEQDRNARVKELATLKDELAKIDAEATNRVNRRKEVRTRLAALEKEAADVGQQLSVSAPADENSALTLAKKTESLARQQALASERPALDSELQAYDAEDAVDIIRVQRDLKTQQVSLATIELQIAESLEKRKKDIAAREQVRTARDDVTEYAGSPLLKPLAERNFKLSDLNQQVTKELATAKEELKNTKATLDQLADEFASTRRRVDSVGLPASVGAMLRKLRADLPTVRQHRAAIRDRQAKIETAQIAFYDHDEEDSELADVDKAVARYVDEGDFDGLSRAQVEQSLPQVKVLLSRRKEYLDPLLRNQEDLFDALTELSFAEQQLIQKTEEFSDYIDERVLWIRSGQSLIDEVRTSESRDRTSQNYRESLARLASPSNWKSVGQLMMNDAKTYPGIYVACVALFAFLFRLAVPCRREIREISEQVKRSAFSHFFPTLKAAGLTALIVVPWPALLSFIAWRLQLTGNGNDFSGGLSLGLQLVALAYFSLDLLRQICRSNGLAEAHLEWPNVSVNLLRRNLRWLMLIGLPVILLTSIVRFDDTALGKNSFERLLFIAGTILCSVFLAKILRPSSGIFQHHVTLNPNGWASRLRHVWYGIAVASPILLAGLAFFGYYYTAQQLAWRIYLTTALLATLLIAHSLVSRLLLVHRRRLSIEQARQRRAAAVAAAAAEENPENVDPTAALASAETTSIEDSLADLRTQTSQARRLLTTALLGAAFIGLWLTWTDVVPALGFLERWPLWESMTQEITTVVDDAGNVQRQTRDIIDPVTIADLTFAILIAIVTIIAARNLPGLLEISVLQQLPLETSVRYAITTLCSYAIILIGLIVSCNMIGVHWNQVQWMATALMFGLAFGLQEMFANFVAGIIILFERPIRVGDIVTLGDISGTVSRVRIRATTITDPERKDFVVPNKDFITGRVLNWTLSDQVNRILLNVGVAYGSDTKLAKQILLKIAKDHPQVVDEPPPQATFEEFGDSSLLLRLRSFIAMRDMAGRNQIIDDLHSSIDEEFKKANIEIAFPQQDLHVRSFTPAINVESPAEIGRKKDTGRPSNN